MIIQFDIAITLGKFRSSSIISDCLLSSAAFECQNTRYMVLIRFLGKKPRNNESEFWTTNGLQLLLNIGRTDGRTEGETAGLNDGGTDGRLVEMRSHI